MSYAHFSLKERFRIENLLSFDWKQCEIASDLNRSEGSISKEINRNGGRKGYRAWKAHSHAFHARKKGGRESKKLLINKSLASLVEICLTLSWSPEQISGRLNTVCPETIYQWIYTERRDLSIYLRRKKNKYRRRQGTKTREKRREEAKKRRIDTRPDIVNKRGRLGDWEGDTIVGGERTTGILTHVDRKSGYLLADILHHKTAESVWKTTVKRFSHITRDKRKTIIYDNGTEFSSFEFIERYTKATVYFAYPYHSWERGTNENTNGLLREYFPKKSLFAMLAQKDVDDAVNLINHRPRKRLGYLTPYEVFIKEKTFASS